MTDEAKTVDETNAHYHDWWEDVLAAARIEGAEAMKADFDLMLQLRVVDVTHKGGEQCEAVLDELRFIQERWAARNPRAVVEKLNAK